MNTKTISTRAVSVIDQFTHLKVGGAVCSVPYFNNRTARARAALRVYAGKGSPRDIFEEIQVLATKDRIPLEALADDSLKKLLVENNIGIDCSAFAYYVLNAECQELGKGSIDRHASFINCRGIIGKIRCSFRPIENCDVSTFAHDKNSKAVPIKDARPGDIITMTGGLEANERDHILVIHRIEYQNFVPFVIHYSHAVAYPEDGLYGSGIRQGTIDVAFPDKPITEARWTEDGKEGADNRIFIRAQRSKTEVRRLNWL